MNKQRTFGSLAWDRKGKVTRREQFLAEMDAVIPRKELVALIEPHYPKAGRGRQPLGIEKMLRIYFLQFAGVELADDVVPDETTILRFRHLLEAHGLTNGIFDFRG